MEVLKMGRKEVLPVLLSASIVAEALAPNQHANHSSQVRVPEPHTEIEIPEPRARATIATSATGGTSGKGVPYGLGPYGAVIKSDPDGDGGKPLVGPYGG
jgi:hypothetical protein